MFGIEVINLKPIPYFDIITRLIDLGYEELECSCKEHIHAVKGKDQEYPVTLQFTPILELGEEFVYIVDIRTYNPNMVSFCKDIIGYNTLLEKIETIDNLEKAFAEALKVQFTSEGVKFKPNSRYKLN